jgi:hypothetical protein
MQEINKTQYKEMLEILPPLVWYETSTGEIFQNPEPYDEIEGVDRFMTYETRKDSKGFNRYYYRGVEPAHYPEEDKIIMANGHDAFSQI